MKSPLKRKLNVPELAERKADKPFLPGEIVACYNECLLCQRKRRSRFEFECA